MVDNAAHIEALRRTTVAVARMVQRPHALDSLWDMSLDDLRALMRRLSRVKVTAEAMTADEGVALLSLIVCTEMMRQLGYPSDFTQERLTRQFFDTAFAIVSHLLNDKSLMVWLFNVYRGR